MGEAKTITKYLFNAHRSETPRTLFICFALDLRNSHTLHCEQVLHPKVIYVAVANIEGAYVILEQDKGPEPCGLEGFALPLPPLEALNSMVSGSALPAVSTFTFWMQKKKNCTWKWFPNNCGLRLRISLNVEKSYLKEKKNSKANFNLCLFFCNRDDLVPVG